MFATALTDRDAPVPTGIRARSPEAARSRFTVHRNNVNSGLVAALASRFPVTNAIVGPGFFRAVASRFVDDHRPSSPMLMSYGDDFPAWLSGRPEIETLPYLPDVALFEVAVSAAYHAADATPLTVAALGEIAAGDLGTARFVGHPAGRLFRSCYPVGSIWSAHQPGGRPSDVIFRAEAVLVTRPGAEIRLNLLTDADAAFAGALLAGAPLGEAAEGAFAADPGFDFGRSLVAAVAGGAFTAITLEGSLP